MNYTNINTSGYEDIKNELKVSTLAAKVLASMNLNNEEIKEILYDTKTTNDFELSFLNEVADRIYKAKQSKEKIMICGDYDCDGICATTILYDALCQYGCEVGYYIPDRFKEGYGAQVSTIKQAIEKGYTLFITVDNGVKATEALQYAKDHGGCVILSDHHSYDEKDLVYDYFFHSKVLPTYYQELSGAGLAFLLSKKLIGNNEYHTVLAGIATIGDMVGVLHANRAIIKEAIRLLNTRSFLTIQEMASDRSRWDATKIAFQIVPKINVFGRLADKANANMFVRYLLLNDEASIKTTAKEIDELNTIRKDLTKQGEVHALSKVNEDDGFIIVADADFHEGLNGIVASKLINKYHKPAMVLSVKDGIAKGSIRSVGVDLTTFFDDAKDLFIHYGGHAQAAGLSIEEKNIKTLQAYANDKMMNIEIEEHKEVLEVTLQDVSVDEVLSLSTLEPFGVDFKKPLFMLKDTVTKIQTLSKGVHLKFISDHMQYLYFFHGAEEAEFTTSSYCFIGDISINEFRNVKSTNMIVEDVIE